MSTMTRDRMVSEEIPMSGCWRTLLLVASLRARWFKEWRQCDQHYLRVPPPTPEVERNLEVLRQLIGLSPAETQLLLFLVVAESLRPVARIVEMLCALTSFETVELFAVATQIDS